MANVSAESTPIRDGCKMPWRFVFDDAANTVTITASHMHVDDTPAPDPQQAELEVELNSALAATVNLVTGKFIAPSPAQIIGNDFSQASPGKILNNGPKTMTGVKLKVSADRALQVGFKVRYLP